MSKALDVSYGAEDITPEWCEKRIAEGYTHLGVNLWAGIDPMPHANRALRHWRGAGGKTIGYFALNSHRNGIDHAEMARGSAGGEWQHLEYVAVDCEVDGITVRQIQEAVDAVVALGGKPIIYTAYWWWKLQFGDPQDFKHLPLWNAIYDGDPDLDFSNYPYGGWTTNSVIMEQYQGTTDLDGVAVDLNVFYDQEDVDVETIIQALHVIWKVADNLETQAKAVKDAVVEIKKVLGIN